MAVGIVKAIRGVVVDVEFPQGELPEIYESLEIAREEGRLVLEVQQHLDLGLVRTVAMDSTDGLSRGVEVIATGAPIMVPVGPATLGRVFNILGEAIDGSPTPSSATSSGPSPAPRSSAGSGRSFEEFCRDTGNVHQGAVARFAD